METIDIPLSRLAILYLMLAIPIFLLWRLRLGVVQEVLVSVARMSVQLVLVGLYLKYIFAWNNWWLSGLWVMVIMLVANYNILKKVFTVIPAFFRIL